MDNISKYVLECLDANDWNDCYIVEVKISASKKIEVYLDRDEGISFEICRKVSRYIEEKIDTSLEFGEKYTLEVSSPGIGSPLKLLKQYYKNIGRKVVVKTLDSTVTKGVMKEVSDDFILVEVTSGKKNSKKKIITEKKIEMNDIMETKIAVSFKS